MPKRSSCPSPALALALFAAGLSIAAPAPAAAQERRALSTADGERSYLLDLPPAARRAPLVIVLHGAMGSSEQVRDYTGWSRIAAREGIVVAYPQGIDRTWNDGRPPAARRYRPDGGKTDDVGFIRAMVAALSREGRIDPGRVYVTGISNGGHLGYRLACEAGDLLRAAAPVIANLSAAVAAGCRGRPVPILIMNGTQDRLAAWEGEAPRGGPDSAMLSAPDTFSFFARRNGCGGPPGERRLPERVADGTAVTVISGTGCRAPARLYRVEGGGHQMPGANMRAIGPGLRRIMGANSGQIDGTEEIWRFFAEN